MANIPDGYCDNLDLYRYLYERYKDLPTGGVTPMMIYLEEVIRYLEDQDITHEFTMMYIVKCTHKYWKRMDEDSKKRYIDLADEYEDYRTLADRMFVGFNDKQKDA